MYKAVAVMYVQRTQPRGVADGLVLRLQNYVFILIFLFFFLLYTRMYHRKKNPLNFAKNRKAYKNVNCSVPF